MPRRLGSDCTCALPREVLYAMRAPRARGSRIQGGADREGAVPDPSVGACLAVWGNRRWHPHRTTSAARRLDAGDKTKEMRNPPPSKREDGSRPEATGSGQPQPIPAGGERSRPATSRLPRSMDSSGAIVGGGRERGKGREGRRRRVADQKYKYTSVT
jgi:hypothetical protein